MDIETRVELPDGHLVNLSPRPQRQTQYRAYRVNYTTTEPLTTTSPQYSYQAKPSEPVEHRGSLDVMAEKVKVTKLPIPRPVADRRDQRNQTPSPTSIPRPSSILSSGGSGGAPRGSGDRDRDQYWRKVRDRSEKESPLSKRTSYVRSREGDRKVSPIWPQNSSPGNSPRHDLLPKSSSIPKSVIPSLSSTNNLDSTHDNRLERLRHSDGQKKWRMHGDQWVSLDINETSPRKLERGGSTSESSLYSHPSISPVSAEDSSMTDWEDRFVVHMPTAKEPNPPTMTAQEIMDYQQNLQNVRRTNRHVHDPEDKPIPRYSLVEERRSSGGGQQRQSTEQFMAYDGRQTQLKPEDGAHSSEEIAPYDNQEQPHYYCPDEVGKNRISTIWEESPTKPREKPAPQNEDGSFLGCKEINGPTTRNPDEILLFATGEDSASLHPRPLAVNAKKRQKEMNTTADRPSRKLEEKAVLQEEWSQITRNSKHVPCSKPLSATMCHDQVCTEREVPRSNSQGSSKENFHPTQSPRSHNDQLDGRGEDDVFIITPTITRTMIPTPNPEKKVSVPKLQGLRRPGGIGQSGTGEAVKAIRAKPQVISTPAGLRAATGPPESKSSGPSLEPSKTTTVDNIPTAKDKNSDKDSIEKNIKDKTKSSQKEKEKDKAKDKDDRERSSHTTSSSIRGFIRTTGLARSTGLVRSPTDSLASMLRSGTESLRNRAESLRNSTSRKGSPVSQLPSRDNSGSDRSFRSAKETPMSSAKPSPAKKDDQPSKSPPPGKQTTPSTPSQAEKTPLVEKKSSVEKKVQIVNVPSVEKTPPPAKSPSLEKSPQPEKTEKLSRAERLEKFKEQARLRRTAKITVKETDTTAEVAEVKDIAELDGHQVTGRKGSLQPNITDVCDEFQDLQSRETQSFNEGSNTMALSLVFDILIVGITHMHKLGLQAMDSPYAKFAMSNVLNMIRHCFRVSSHLYEVLSIYQTTGKWPKAKDDQAISRFLVELLQAVVYICILGFGALVISRAAGYLLLLGTWILWFVRPFVWACQCVTRALMT